MRFKVRSEINLFLGAQCSSACNDTSRTMLDTIKFPTGIAGFHNRL